MSKKIRMGRLFNYNSDKTFLLPIDHGITLGPIKGINSYCDTVKLAASGGVGQSHDCRYYFRYVIC
mgnify:CR=1 FL=1